MLFHVARAIKALCVFIAIASLGGCADPFGHLFAAKNSYDLKGERVEVSLLTQKDFIEEVNEINGKLPAGTTPIINPLASPRIEAVASAASSLGGALVGAAIDAVKAEIEADAARYNHSFAGSVFVPDFWTIATNDATKTQTATLKYRGLWVRRFTSDHSTDEAPAFEMLAYFDTSRDKQLFIVEPLYARICGSSAKLTGSTEKVTVQLTEHTTWIDGSQKLQDLDLITSTWNAGTLELQKAITFPKPAENAFDKPIVAVPVSASAGQPNAIDGKPNANSAPTSGGICKFAVVVTESEPSDVQANEKLVATFLGNNKDTIIKTFNLTPPTTQKSDAGGSTTQPSSADTAASNSNSSATTK